jgi:hypothetical protein
MNRAFRCTPLLLVVFALLLALPGLGAAEERPAAARVREAREAFEAVASPQAASCGICALAYQRCNATCFSRGDKAGMGACLTQCDNVAATCSCDQQGVNLRSEDLVQWDWPGVTKAACHGSVSCQPNYPSCASWSGYSNCDDPFCGQAPHCGECTCDEFRCFCGPGPALKQKQERFRVCFDSLGNSCTEWQTLTINSCDDSC